MGEIKKRVIVSGASEFIEAVLHEELLQHGMEEDQHKKR